MSDKDKSNETLVTEQQALQSFLSSPEYQVAQKVVDLDIQTGIDFMIDIEVRDVGTLAQLLEAKGEVRAARKFRQRFLDRLDEIKNLLDKSKQPLDD